MKKDITRYVSQCDVCSRVKAGHQKPAGWLQPLPPPDWKWDKVEMDFVTDFPKSQKGNDAIFVAIDRFSKIAHFLPVKEKITASQLAYLYISRIVSLYGIPLEIIQTVAAFSPHDTGKVSWKPSGLVCLSAPLITP